MTRPPPRHRGPAVATAPRASCSTPARSRTRKAGRWNARSRPITLSSSSERLAKPKPRPAATRRICCCARWNRPILAAGLALLRSVRADPLLGTMPFFFFLGADDGTAAAHVRLQCLDAGADDVLLLPALSDDELRARLRSRLALTRRRLDYAGERARLENDTRFRMLSETAPVLLWKTDPGGRMTYRNERMADFAGPSPAVMPGGQPPADAHPEDAVHGLRILQEALARREPFACEYRQRRADGEWRWVASRGEPQFGPDNEFLGYVGAMLDVTERKTMEGTLRAREDQLRLIVESARDFAIFSMDADLAVTTWNPGAEAILGWPAAEMIGQSGALIFTPEDRAARQPEQEAETARRDGRAEDERWHLRRDGTRFWGSGVMMMMMADGREVGFLKIMRDLTAVRVAEEARRQAEERFRVLVESVKDYAIFLLDAEGHITSWNAGAERIKGYAEAEVIGRPAAIFYPPEDVAAEVPERELLAARTVGRIETESWRVRKSGERFWAQELILALRDDAAGTGELLGFATICRDLTTQKSADNERAQLLAAERMARAEAESANVVKDRFLAVLSHELRTPLTPMQMALYALRREKRLTAGGRKMLELIGRNLHAETQLIDDLLDVSRIVHGKLELSREPLDLHACVRDALEVCHADFTAKSLRLDVALTAGDPTVEGDRSRLQQVFWNLLKNAAKFTPSGGSVTVRSRNPEPGRITVEVADDGIGIEPAALPKIFDPFEQGGAQVVRRYGGLGLGLAISHAVVDTHGGQLAASSAGPGRGATFTVSLATLPDEK